MRTATLLAILSAILILACSKPTLEDVSCESYMLMPDYDTMMRYPERVGGECYEFSGRVVDVNYNDQVADVWIDTSPYPTYGDRRVVIVGEPSCFRSTGRVLVGDQVSIVAALAFDPLQFESVAAGMLEVPMAFCSR